MCCIFSSKRTPGFSRFSVEILLWWTETRKKKTLFTKNLFFFKSVIVLNDVFCSVYDESLGFSIFYFVLHMARLHTYRLWKNWETKQIKRKAEGRLRCLSFVGNENENRKFHQEMSYIRDSIYSHLFLGTLRCSDFCFFEKMECFLQK